MIYNQTRSGVAFSSWTTPANPAFDFKVLLDAAVAAEADEPPISDGDMASPPPSPFSSVLSFHSFFGLSSLVPKLVTKGRRGDWGWLNPSHLVHEVLSSHPNSAVLPTKVRDESTRERRK